MHFQSISTHPWTFSCIIFSSSPEDLHRDRARARAGRWVGACGADVHDEDSLDTLGNEGPEGRPTHSCPSGANGEPSSGHKKNRFLHPEPQVYPESSGKLLILSDIFAPTNPTLQIIYGEGLKDIHQRSQVPPDLSRHNQNVLYDTHSERCPQHNRGVRPHPRDTRVCFVSFRSNVTRRD